MTLHGQNKLSKEKNGDDDGTVLKSSSRIKSFLLPEQYTLFSLYNRFRTNENIFIQII